MTDCLQWCLGKYYSQNNEETIQNLIEQKLSITLPSISHELLCIFDNCLSTEPGYYFNKEVFMQTYDQLEILYSRNNTIIIDENMFNRFLIGYQSHQQISEIITVLEQLNDSQEIKTRLYRIPTYISIVEGCLSNLFRFVVLVINQVVSEDLSSLNNLSPLCEVLIKHGFGLLVQPVDRNLRNAINHGGVIFKKGSCSNFEIEFHYKENHAISASKFTASAFDKLIENVYDLSTGILLGIVTFLNNHCSSISFNKSEKTFEAFSLLGMEISIPEYQCKSIFGLPNDKQLNIEFYAKHPDVEKIQQIALMLSVIIFDRYKDYGIYMISFTSERMQTGWLRFTNKEVHSLYFHTDSFAQVLKKAIERNDVVIWDPSIEDIDLQEIKYYRYPNFYENNIKINHVEDASLSDRKRLKCCLFIGDIDDKAQILEAIKKGIEWLKNVKNVPSPTFLVKNGTMEADALYINVYRYDSRKDKELFPSNDNFVCFVDYNKNGETTLKEGGLPNSIWTQLSHEKIGNLEIAWRNNKYFKKVKKKIGMNNPCPCGSGKKFKKCCRGKGLYD